MASNEDKQRAITEQKHTKDQKPIFENPFIAFRRFADESIGSTLQSIIGLPSAVTKQLEGALPGLEKIRNDNARQRKEADSLKDQFRREQPQLGNLGKKTSNPDSETPHELIEELKRHREQHRKRWENIKEAIHQGPDAAYTSREMTRKGNMDDAAWIAFHTNCQRDHDNPQVSSGTSFMGNPLHEFMEPFSKSMGPNTLGPLGAGIFSRLSTMMSLDGFGPYLIFSPYSPLAITNNLYQTSDKDGNILARDAFPYCEAFEDLLLASRGREMVPREARQGRPSALSQYYGPLHSMDLAVSWLSQLQKQGLLDDPLRAGSERLEEEDGTELGMYSQFLSSAFPKTATHIPQEQHESFKGPVTKSNESDPQQAPFGSVLSVLTQTECKKFPDGRVETKVVLIKRFADGGETRTETVHTNHEEADRRQFDSSKATEEKKGWFWN